nr:low specificity L-threonine aldolase [Victivallis sp. Marseille-Q1083]
MFCFQNAAQESFAEAGCSVCGWLIRGPNWKKTGGRKVGKDGKMRENFQQLVGDNCSGVCPEALAAIAEANQGSAASYGEDRWTALACEKLREWFETDCEIFFVFNGTAANGLALAHLCRSYQSIVCTAVSHIETDECGGPEFFTHGAKLLHAGSGSGKLTVPDIERVVRKRRDIHYPRPRVVSLTQATELGTVYSVDELKTLGAAAAEHRLRLHMDGARFVNAVAELGVKPREISWECGVDVLSLGGTKNGLLGSEAVIFFNRELAGEFDFRCKQAGQLASKMRFMAAQWLGVLDGDVLLANAKHANAMAERLAEGMLRLGRAPMFRRQANSVFVELPERAMAHLKKCGWLFYTFIGAGGARFMCSWNTSPETVDRFLEDLKQGLAE